MGNKPNASAALSEKDIQVLFEKDLLGSSTAEALLNTVLFYNIIHFGLLGCKENRQMCWGDVKLCRNFHRAGVPRIQWKRNQNSFKKRSTECKSHCTENVFCAEQPEMSSKGLQSLRRKRPVEMKVQSITRYSTVSKKQQLNMSPTLSGMSSGEIAPQSGSSILEKRKHEFDKLTYPTFRPTFSQQSKQAAQQPVSLFFGCCSKRRTYRCGNKHFKSIAHTFSVRGKP